MTKSERRAAKLAASMQPEVGTEIASEVAAPQPEPTPTKVPTLQVKAATYRGARAAWYAVLAEYNGKPVADFVAHVTANRPSVYGARSKHSGQPEPVAGWLQFFVRTGVATIVQ